MTDTQLTFGDDFILSNSVTMREIPAYDRPRERLEKLGPRALSDSELLSILLISGTKGINVIELARALLVRFEDYLGLTRATIHELMALSGIGKSKAIRIQAAFELGRRSIKPRHTDLDRITSPADGASYLMADMQHLEQEHLRVLLLSTRNENVASPTIYIGSLNTSVVRIGEIFRAAIRANAAAMIVAHNHPSGDPSPSPEDIKVTRQLVKAGKLIDIEVLDHLIIGHDRFVSLKERKLGFD